MELWKIGVILGLFAALIGFKAMEQNATDNPSPTPTAQGTPAPPSPLLGTTPPAWKIPAAADWVNTPKPITLPSLKGSVSVIEIFRTECSHCQEAAPVMAALGKYYAPKGVKFIGIQSPGRYQDIDNPENDWKTVKTWIKDRDIEYPVAFDRDSAYFQGSFPLKNKLYPCMFVLDKNNKIVFFDTGEDEKKLLKLTAAIEKQLGTGSDLPTRLGALSKLLAAMPLFADSSADAIQGALNEMVHAKGEKVAKAPEGTSKP